MPKLHCNLWNAKFQTWKYFDNSTDKAMQSNKRKNFSPSGYLMIIFLKHCFWRMQWNSIDNWDKIKEDKSGQSKKERKKVENCFVNKREQVVMAYLAQRDTRNWDDWQVLPDCAIVLYLFLVVKAKSSNRLPQWQYRNKGGKG